eukprot:CAMPEP_0184463082 /NCGR_PEP_ID=MMETSP0740-20130409/50748_1 /TAXON_ID=385413 /ORGANISM="Thalassiosira miniscula, Strain CCMP1093" /LENGTH=273 /DNA_ID=CAMNT_0026837177 /DNA_START=105 /DNA_END=924 /DNA_ORIENTATION=-
MLDPAEHIDCERALAGHLSGEHRELGALSLSARDRRLDIIDQHVWTYDWGLMVRHGRADTDTPAIRQIGQTGLSEFWHRSTECGPCLLGQRRARRIDLWCHDFKVLNLHRCSLHPMSGGAKHKRSWIGRQTIVFLLASKARCSSIQAGSTLSFLAILSLLVIIRQNGLASETGLPSAMSSSAASATMRTKIAVDIGQVPEQASAAASASRISGIVSVLPCGILRIYASTICGVVTSIFSPGCMPAQASSITTFLMSFLTASFSRAVFFGIAPS